MFEGDELHESLAACEQSDASWEYMTGRFLPCGQRLASRGEAILLALLPNSVGA